jgi:diguanylate cyclase (GGDEF)-like protein
MSCGYNCGVSSTFTTLLEQMRITDLEISRRKELLDFIEQDETVLAGWKYKIQAYVDEIVDEFYRRQTAVDEIALVIGDADTLQRLRVAQRRYILDLFNGFYDVEYVNNRLRIGLVHKRIGVGPKLYLSAILALKGLLFGIIEREEGDAVKASLITRSLEKLLQFDTTLVFDTYIRSLLSEIEVAKDQAELYAHSLEEKVAARTQELRELSRKDALTALYNRRAFLELLRRDLTQAKRNQQPISLVYFDVDSFKTINDTQGHIKGDEVLSAVGESLHAVSREVDIPARYGGDEFCCALPGSDLNGARVYAERLIADFADRQPGVTLSIGLVQTGPDDFVDVDQMIRLADENMYRAKQAQGSAIIG